MVDPLDPAGILRLPCTIEMAKLRAEPLCSVPVLPPLVNRWLLARGFAGSMPDANTLRDEATEFVMRAVQGAAGEMRIRVAADPTALQSALDGAAPLRSRAQCPFPMTTRGANFALVLVEFRATGKAPRSVGWPASQPASVLQLPMAPENCPALAEWLLDTAFTPGDTFRLDAAEVPDPTLFDKLKEKAKDAAEVVGGAVVGAQVAIFAASAVGLVLLFKAWKAGR